MGSQLLGTELHESCKALATPDYRLLARSHVVVASLLDIEKHKADTSLHVSFNDTLDAYNKLWKRIRDLEMSLAARQCSGVGVSFPYIASFKVHF